MGPLVMYYLSLIVSIHASATKESLIVPLEQSFGASGAWRPRVEVTLEPHTSPHGTLIWRANATTAGALLDAELKDAAAAMENDGFLRVRARHPSGTWVFGGARLCALAMANWKHDIVFSLDAAGAVRSLEVRPGTAPGATVGCVKAQRAGTLAPLPPAGAPWHTRFGVAGTEDVGAQPAGSMGAPFPGQRPLSEVEALAAAARKAAAAGAADPAAQAALAAAEEREALAREAKKGWLERLQPYLLPFVVVMALQSFFGGRGEDKPAKK